MLRKLFFDLGYHTLMQIVNKLCLIFHTTIYIWQVIYFKDNVNRKTILQYCPFVMGMPYVSISHNVYDKIISLFHQGFSKYGFLDNFLPQKSGQTVCESCDKE
jgi:hypothetical protein